MTRGAVGIGFRLLGLALMACTGPDAVLGAVTGVSSGGGTSVEAGNGTDAFCGVPGPKVTLASRNGSGSYEACTGRIAAAYFLNALCSCHAASFASSLVTVGFDSSRGSYQPGQADDSGASVGINGAYTLLAGSTDVGGSLSVAGPDRMQLVGSLLVRGDFRSGGDVSLTGSALIARNAWLAGSYTGLGALTVGGELHHQGSVTALLLTALVNRTESVTIDKPCACESEDLLDVGSLVQAAESSNDNGRAALRPDALASVADSASIRLPCGRFYLDRIAGSGNVLVDVTGPAALFVGGSVDLEGNLQVRIAPGAEVDLFVRQDLSVAGRLELGDTDRPAAGRLYLGGTAEVVLTSPFIGNLYAPGARVSSPEALEVWGSVFCGEFASSGSAKWTYDRSVLAAGSFCSAPRPPAGSCAHCGSCSGGTACVDGECGPCRVDGDCCSQSVCANGSCVALVEVR